jgi:hypothetical protein
MSNASRYYLHRKLRHYGATVHPKARLIEIEDKLFHNPTPLLSTYLHKSKQLNYNVQ